RAEDWADDHAALVEVLRWIEIAFATLGMTILTVLLVIWLFVRRHRWAALLAAIVMAVTSLATTGLKLWLGRERPEWQDAVGTHATHSFPSGHASSAAAFAGVLVVLAVIFIRRRALRRLAVGAAVA